MNATPAPSGRVLQGRRVLVVEDDYMIGDALHALLEAEGAEVLGPIGRTAEALAFVLRPDSRVDLAVLDVDLHGERSYPVADALAAIGIPFLFTTGYNVDSVAPDYRRFPRCEKPIGRRVLLDMLSHLIETTAAPEPA